jgi:selenocysteine-specific elongation factor
MPLAIQKMGWYNAARRILSGPPAIDHPFQEGIRTPTGSQGHCLPLTWRVVDNETFMKADLDKPALSTPNEPKSLILGTAGHVDHGKTSLVKALTGIDTDRLPQEKARGLTIELGFAHLDLPGVRFGIVDVPGHEKFIKTMVSGAAGIEVGMLVIAADDGIMPQTLEHLDILRFLGVETLLVALSKIDLVDADPMPELFSDIAELLRKCKYHDAPIIPVSATTGQGLDQLTAALVDAARRCQPPKADGPFRLAVDRAFSIQGRGTVITGSVLSGSLTEDQTVEILPIGRICKIREVHRHGEHVGTVKPGERAAMNLPGISRNDIQRGDEIAHPGWFSPSTVLDVQLECSHNAEGIKKPFTDVRLGIGARELSARLVLFGHNQLPPGENGYAQLRLSEPVIAAHNQRFIIRHMTENVTLAGGRILQPNSKKTRRATPNLIEHLANAASPDPAARLLEAYRFTELEPLSRKHRATQCGLTLKQLEEHETSLKQKGSLMPFPQGTCVLYAATAIEKARQAAAKHLDRHHRLHPDDPGLPADAFKGWLVDRFGTKIGKALLNDMLDTGAVLAKGNFTALPTYKPALSNADNELLEKTIQAYDASAFVPPDPAQLAEALKIDEKRIRSLLRLAASQQKLIPINRDLYLHHDRFEALQKTIRQLIHDSGPSSASTIRKALDSNRKTVIPLLEHLDRIGFTMRVGNNRQLKE